MASKAYEKDIKLKFINPVKKRVQTVSYTTIRHAQYNARGYMNYWNVDVGLYWNSECWVYKTDGSCVRDDNWKPGEK